MCNLTNAEKVQIFDALHANQKQIKRAVTVLSTALHHPEMNQKQIAEYLNVSDANISLVLRKYGFGRIHGRRIV